MASPDDMAQYDSALSFLYNRIDYERTTVPERSHGLKLERMRRLLGLLGDPHQALRIVHIAGTKGKGSTAALIAGALTAAGFRTGLYTSPHLEHVEERIAIDGIPVTSTKFAELVEAVQPAVRQLDEEASLAGEPGNGPTFFEITTAMTLLHFGQQQTDAAVLEVGLGGRLDSTNVCNPLVTVITSISIDHTKQLGDTLSAIAGEKAGIIKPGIPVVTGVEESEPLAVIEDVAARNGSKIFRLRREFDFSYQLPISEKTEGISNTSFPTICYTESDVALPHSASDRAKSSLPSSLENFRIGMLGKHQAANAATALATLRRLAEMGWNIPADAVRRAFANVHCPARIECFGERPAVVIDTAHNLASVQALLRVLDDHFPTQKRVLIFAASRDKDIPGMLKLLLPKFNFVLLTRFGNSPRGMSEAELSNVAHQIRAAAVSREDESYRSGEHLLADNTAHIQTFPDSHSAWRHAHTLLSTEGLLCVTGSFFLAAELRALANAEKLVANS